MALYYTCQAHLELNRKFPRPSGGHHGGEGVASFDYMGAAMHEFEPGFKGLWCPGANAIYDVEDHCSSHVLAVTHLGSSTRSKKYRWDKDGRYGKFGDL